MVSWVELGWETPDYRQGWSPPLTLCLPPPNKEKAGVCPVDNVRCIRSEDPLCYRDRNCEGEQKCCYLHCRNRCVQPVKTLEDSK